MLFSLMSVAQRSPMEAEMVAMIELALARAGYSHKAAAIGMGKDESQFSRELGRGTLRYLDLFALEAPFWQEFLPLVAARYGMQVTSEDSVVRAMSDMNELMGRMVRQLHPVRLRISSDVLPQPRKVKGL